MADAYGLLHEPDGYYPSIANAKARIRAGAKGETSHFWKGQIQALREAFPDATFYHLVRDGRAVVRSFLGRLHYSPDAKFAYQKAPLPPHKPGMSREELICWYWRYWNERIEADAPDVIRVRMEDIPDLPRRNAGKPGVLWTDAAEDAFRRICSDLNRRYGYRP